MTTAWLDDERLAAIDRLVARELEQTRVPGLAVALTDRDGPASVRSYGLADIGALRPVTPDTVFEIGSIGKTFTAVVVLQLVEEGRLDLGARVADVLRWFEMPVVGRPVTIHDLLTHTAGITSGIDDTPEGAFQVWALRNRRPGSPPGERFHYSNLGYKILGLVIEALEGRPYPDVLRDRILGPLRMTATEPAITSAIRPRLAVGYDQLRDDRIGHPGQPLVPANWLETATADGSIASTAGDMALFMKMLLRRGEGPGGRLLSEASFARMAEPAIWSASGLGYGYALATRIVGGRTLVGHSGGMVGYLAGLQLDPAAGLASVVLANGMMAEPVALARAILLSMTAAKAIAARVKGAATAYAEPEDDPEDRPREAAEPGEPDRTGTYHAHPDHRSLEPLDIVHEHGGPMIRWKRRLIPLEPWGGGRFLAPDPDFDRFTLNFEPGDSRPDLVWHGGDRFVRDGAAVPPLPEPDPVTAGLAGHYRSHNPWTTNFRVILRGDVAWITFAAAPDSFDEQPLVPLPDGTFRVGDDPRGPEDVRFDAVVEGRPLRAWLSGYPYYRVG